MHQCKLCTYKRLKWNRGKIYTKLNMCKNLFVILVEFFSLSVQQCSDRNLLLNTLFCLVHVLCRG